jgi:hypothetical protein
LRTGPKIVVKNLSIACIFLPLLELTSTNHFATSRIERSR